MILAQQIAMGVLAATLFGLITLALALIVAITSWWIAPVVAVVYLAVMVLLIPEMIVAIRDWE